ncbi:UNKNOWN [Stylonychia lemnae]|uniref:Morn repeat protein n=1 Tax=Stylonychia lemnae TaxID=5949 RepID=A0A078AFY7_STYLE|nr:UNKNOWN [Stylonychia lemnae]|eukprot:CDW81139.1 UNKNOWN [Stylonychia lemnae]
MNQSSMFDQLDTQTSQRQIDPIKQSFISRNAKSFDKHHKQNNRTFVEQSNQINKITAHQIVHKTNDFHTGNLITNAIQVQKTDSRNAYDIMRVYNSEIQTQPFEVKRKQQTLTSPISIQNRPNTAQKLSNINNQQIRPVIDNSYQQQVVPFNQFNTLSQDSKQNSKIQLGNFIIKPENQISVYKQQQSQKEQNQGYQIMSVNQMLGKQLQFASFVTQQLQATEDRFGPRFEDNSSSGNNMKSNANKKATESFWVRYITKVQILKEVRWDLFEEGLCEYIKTFLVMNAQIIKRINWPNFLQKLKSLICDDQSTGEFENADIVHRPLEEVVESYTGPVVSFVKIIQFSQEISLDGKIMQLIEETQNKDDPVTDFRYQSEISSPKSSVMKQKQFKDSYNVEQELKQGTIRYQCGSSYRGDLFKSRKHGQGLLMLSNGDQYEGQFKSGQRNGYGVYIWGPDNRCAYKGDWVEDIREGYGEIQWDDGSRFQGQWIKGRFQSGIYVWPDGSEYSGEFNIITSDLEGQGILTLENEVVSGFWKNSKLNGYGMRKSANGEVYKGTWVNGKLENEGEYENQSGKFVGKFIKNKENGFGTKIFADGSTYSGDWKDGLQNGKGELKSANGDSYFGDFVNGFKNGRGTLKYKNGNVYEGDWKNDMQDGIGKFTLPNNNKASPFKNEYIGGFKNNLFDGKGKITNELGVIYEGDWIQQKKQGFGKLIVPRDGQNLFSKNLMQQVYVGEFFNDKIHGYGKMIFEDGSTYEGEWINGMKQGKGIEKSNQASTNAKIYKGLFENNKRVGPDWITLNEQHKNNSNNFTTVHKVINNY